MYQFNSLQSQLRQQQPELWNSNLAPAIANANPPVLSQNMADLQMKATALSKRLIGIDELANWKESEADEVGFNFYLKAGFHASEYLWLLQSIEQNLDQGYWARCHGTVISESLLGLPTMVTRGVADHPNDCWRYYDIFMSQLKQNKAVYTPMIEAATTVEAFPGRLRQLQASSTDLWQEAIFQNPFQNGNQSMPNTPNTPRQPLPGPQPAQWGDSGE